MRPTHRQTRVLKVTLKSNLTVSSITYSAGQTPSPSTVCESIGESGRPVLDPANVPAGELDGTCARSLPPAAVWDGSSGWFELGFQIDVLLNHSAILSEGLDTPPMFGMSFPSSSVVLALHEIVAAGLTDSPTSPAVLTLGSRNDYPMVSYLPFGGSSYFQTATTRTVQVSGETDYAYEYQLMGTTPFGPSILQQNWMQVLNGTQDDTERAKLRTLKNDPSSLYASALIWVQPRTFIVQEIAFFHLYGWSSFLSDCGGFLSIRAFVTRTVSGNSARLPSALACEAIQAAQGSERCGWQRL